MYFVRMRQCIRFLSFTHSSVKNRWIIHPSFRLRIQPDCCVGLCHYSSSKRTFPRCGFNEDGDLDNVVVMLQKTFQCSEQEADTIVRSLRAEHLEDLSSLSSSAILLKNSGLRKESLIDFPWVLEHSAKELSCAIRYLNAFHDDINITVPFLQIPLNKLEKISVGARREKYTIGNRIHFVSEALQCEPLEVSRRFAKFKFMFSISMDRLTTVLEVLKEAEIGSEAILNDMWIFQHNIEIMKERVKRAKEAGILPVKPWSLRCEESVFNRMLKRKVEVLKLLGQDTSLEDYLSRKLECHLSEVPHVHSQAPHVGRSSCPRINKLLDYLYSEGFTAADVVKMPRVLTRSLKTVQSRLTELREMGFKVNSLSVICKTRREYKDFISKMKLNRFTEKSLSRIK